jgi:CRISPR-associated exonuclease Cas4
VAKGKTISASELEKYGYCPLSWWLSKNEKDEEDLSEGERRHAKIASEITTISRQEGRAKEFESAVLYFAIAATLISVLGVTILHREQGVGEILIVISLIWMLASSYFLYKAETLATEEDRLISERVVLGFAMIATVIAIYSVSIALFQDLLLSEVLQVVALSWLIGASYFLYRSLKHLDVAKVKREEYDVREGMTSASGRRCSSRRTSDSGADQTMLFWRVSITSPWRSRQAGHRGDRFSPTSCRRLPTASSLKRNTANLLRMVS